MFVLRCARVLLILALASVALAGCTADGHETTPEVATTFGRGVLGAEQNLGDVNDVDAVRAASVAALTDEIQAFAIDPDLRGQEPAQTLSTLTAPKLTRRRIALLDRSHSPALAKDVEYAFVFYARQDFGPHRPGWVNQATLLDSDVWARAAFHVDRWEGVRVAGDTARVLVRGTSWGGTSKRDAWRQEQLILHRDPTARHGWRIIQHGAASKAA